MCLGIFTQDILTALSLAPLCLQFRAPAGSTKAAPQTWHMWSWKYHILREEFVFVINLWFSGYHTWYSKWSFNTTSVQKKVIKLRFCLSKTFWPRCRLIWTASWRFCMNSFGQRWQRNSWKVHKSIVYYSILSIQSAQFFIDCTSVQYWNLNLYSSMLSLMILPRTV